MITFSENISVSGAMPPPEKKLKTDFQAFPKDLPSPSNSPTPSETSEIEEIRQNASTFVNKLQQENQLIDFMNLFTLICTDKFPMRHISFLLLLEVAKWYSSKCSTLMRYSEETKLFWKVG